MRGPRAWAVAVFVGLALAAARPAAAEPTLSLGPATLNGAELAVEVSLSGFVDEELRESLEAGLPAALFLRWRLWEKREGWWDRELASGLLRQRLFYDVLEARYALFDARGRRLALCADSAALAAALAAPRRLLLVLPGPLPAGLETELELEARLEPITGEELRELERWLAGGDGERQPGLLGGVRGGSERFLRRMAGLSSRQASARRTVGAAP